MSTYGSKLSVITSYILITTIPIIFIVMTVVIYRHHNVNTLDSQYFKENYGTMIEGLNLDSLIGVYWNLIILFRWTLTIAVMVSLRDYSALQILILRLTSFTAMLLLVSHKPYDNITDNVTSFLNEVMV